MSLTDRENFCVPIRKIWNEGAWPCFSPDGQQLVFTGLMDQPNNRLMMMPSEGGENPRPITPAHMNAKRPTWLSTTTQIAFNRDQRNIWTVDIATDSLEPFLPESPASAPAYLHPCAYPNERAVVVVAMVDPTNDRVRVLCKLIPGAVVPVMQLTSFPEVCAGRPGVSPDGVTVVFAGNAGGFAQNANQLWVVTPNTKPRRLEEAEPTRAQGRAPRWSPDGKWIACTSTRPSPNPRENTPKAIWIISADGQQAYRLTDHAFNPLHVAWSPDQKRLACGGFGCGLAVLDLPELFQPSSPLDLKAEPKEETHS